MDRVNGVPSLFAYTSLYLPYCYRYGTHNHDESRLYAQTLGVTFTDLIDFALRAALGQEPNPATALLQLLAQYLEDHYLDGFPENITQVVFHHVRDDDEANELYTKAISTEGAVDPAKRDRVHRKVGRTVCAVLNAEPVGLVTKLDPEVNLVQGFTLLAPAAA